MIAKSVALQLAWWTRAIPGEFRGQAEEIVVAAARAGGRGPAHPPAALPRRTRRGHTFPSRSPRPAHPAVPGRRDFVEAAPAFPGDPQVQLPPASPRRCGGEEMDGLSPPSGTSAPRGARVVVLHMSKLRPGRAPPLSRGRWCAPGPLARVLHHRPQPGLQRRLPLELMHPHFARSGSWPRASPSRCRRLSAGGHGQPAVTLPPRRPHGSTNGNHTAAATPARRDLHRGPFSRPRDHSPGMRRLVLLLCRPQQPRSAVASAPRTRPCHTGTRARPRLSTPAIFQPMPTAARRPAVAGYPLACQPSRYPLGQVGNDPP